MKMCSAQMFISTQIKSFSLERFCMRTRFERDAQGNLGSSLLSYTGSVHTRCTGTSGKSRWVLRNTTLNQKQSTDLRALYCRASVNYVKFRCRSHTQVEDISCRPFGLLFQCMVLLTATMKASKQFQTEEKYLTTPRPRILRINSSENTAAKK